LSRCWLQRYDFLRSYRCASTDFGKHDAGIRKRFSVLARPEGRAAL
jgi:hypothetical protein